MAHKKPHAKKDRHEIVVPGYKEEVKFYADWTDPETGARHVKRVQPGFPTEATVHLLTHTQGGCTTIRLSGPVTAPVVRSSLRSSGSLIRSNASAGE